MPRTKLAPPAPAAEPQPDSQPLAKTRKRGPKEAEHQLVPLARLRPSSINPRLVDREGDFLKDSIRQHGFYSALLVRPAGNDLEVIAGNRRLAALQALEWKLPVPVLIRHDLQDDDIGALTLAVSENSEDGRCNLTPDELGAAAKQVMEQTGKTLTAVAKLFACDKSALSRSLSYMDLPEDIRQVARDRKLGERATLILAKIPKEERDKILSEIGENATLREITALRKQVERQAALRAEAEQRTREDATEREAAQADAEAPADAATQRKPGKAPKSPQIATPRRATASWRTAGEKTSMLRRMCKMITDIPESDRNTVDYCEFRGAIGVLLWDRGDFADVILPNESSTEPDDQKILAVFARVVASEASLFKASDEAPPAQG
jgi:ParB family chromosome partitioning protein